MQKRLSLISTVVLLFFVLGLCGCAGGGIKMEYKPKVGEKFKYRTKLTQKMDTPMGNMNMVVTVDMEQKTLKVNGDEIEYNYKVLSSSASMNGKKVNVPKSPDQKIVMDKSGRVIKADNSAMKLNFPMPSKKIKVGDTWKNSDKVELEKGVTLNVDCTYKLVELKKENDRDIAVVDANVVGEAEKDGVTIKCEGTGNTKFDYNAGVLVKSEVKQKITISHEGESMPMEQDMVFELIK